VNTKVSGLSPIGGFEAPRYARSSATSAACAGIPSRSCLGRQQRLPGNGLAACDSPTIVKCAHYQPLTISSTLPTIVMAVHLELLADHLN
jgi:hypothetical protein